MLLKFLYPLVERFSFLNIFRYITFRAAYAAITALLIAFMLGPWVIRKLRAMKAGTNSVREDTPKTHQAKAGTPSMGGVLIVFSVVISALVWMDLDNTYTWLLLLGILGFGSLGFVDDFLKMSARKKGISIGVKFGGQLLAAAILVTLLYLQRSPDTTLLYIPFFKRPVLDLSWFYIPFAVILMVGYSNAVNFTDGLDGLATGLVIMVALSLALISYIAGRVDWAEFLFVPYVKGAGEIMIFCLAVTGAAVGFLWFNAHPAEVIMGDTGSLAFGGIFGLVSMILKKEILLFIIGGVFVLELLSVVIQIISFRLTGKRVFKMAPLHHHFELSGWAESKVVTRLWILGGLFALLGLSTLKIQ
jgi:phospho-N-acetylmuramoyl-pentapeptide-transferase